MIPLQPVSVKFTDEERAKLRALAASLGWSESQVVRDSVAAVDFLVQNPDSEIIPKIVGMARQALRHEENDSLLTEHVNRVHLQSRDTAV
jgi:hypothetical protein